MRTLCTSVHRKKVRHILLLSTAAISKLSSLMGGGKNGALAPLEFSETFRLSVEKVNRPGRPLTDGDAVVMNLTSCEILLIIFHNKG